ncbi:MAG: SDR family NAD(P)-dependent oxidoreductase [Chloroflexi bacterium]|jgi:short-subunit dehydrogenase|nr:SDR family NAD(P)-dependent oxidoreductase [Chloroflexota bacterium]MBT3671193.1 SDR family NAD(P)-dependent oxidoreductase [Chloroflexota bacterium]MBT4002525.1 SDR family NAD(P)-dependent oxidoreductase [Chloroflexota bacterium]MBT4304348.1 SDR family NAD(P)-dependent oxidoreductase [Chloroflexota bacterium]MBT4534367.1 SDR family NAD(P)-dependent oxidoreductase [Chloroflexota bacterium]
MSVSLPVDFPLDPKPRAIVLGASSGIGAATAMKLAKEGHVVALLGRRKKELNTVCEEINQAIGETRAIAYVHDVRKFDQIPKTFQKILTDYKNLDLIVYVSGVMNPVAQNEYDFEKDREMIEINLLGAMAWLGQAAIFFERMGAGKIVGITSVAGDRGRVGNPGYNTSKAGLITYLEALRNRLTRHGVHVLTVKPGFVDTEVLKNSSTTFGVISPEKAADQIWKGIKKKKQTIYTPGWWRLLMLIIQHTPSFIFRRVSF